MNAIKAQLARSLNVFIMGSILAGLLFLSSCGPREEQLNKTALPKLEDYPKLESQLFHLVTAKDPIKFAQQSGLEHAVMVHVIVELESPNSPIPDGIYIDEQYESRVRAWVPIDRLLSLAKEPQVKRIRSLTPVHPDSD